MDTLGHSIMSKETFYQTCPTTSERPKVVPFKVPLNVYGELYHKIDDVERPVCFVSRNLSPTEKNYPQVEKEALGGHGLCHASISLLYLGSEIYHDY